MRTLAEIVEFSKRGPKIPKPWSAVRCFPDHLGRRPLLEVLLWPAPAFWFGAPYCASNANSENSFLLLPPSKTLQDARKILKCPLLRRERVKWMENGNIVRNYETGQTPKLFLPCFSFLTTAQTGAFQGRNPQSVGPTTPSPPPSRMVAVKNCPKP